MHLKMYKFTTAFLFHLRVLGYRSGGPGLGLGLERGPLSLVSTTEELLDRKVAAHV
jgi:hypothetical protein